MVMMVAGCGGGDGAGPVQPRAAGTVFLTPSSAGPLSPGQNFLVKISVDRIPGVFQASLRLRYDASALNLANFQPGGFLGKSSDPPQCVGLLTAFKAIPARNQAILMLSRKGRGCGSTDQVSGELGVLTFTAVRGITDTTNLVSFLSDSRWIQFRNAEGKRFEVGQINPATVQLQLFSE